MVFTVLTKGCFACLLMWALISCNSNHGTDKQILIDIEEGLMRTNSTIHIHNSNAIELLKLKAVDPFTKEKAEIWLPMAEQLQQLYMELHEYIAGLKTMLRKQARMNETNKGDNTNAPVNIVFIKNKKSEELYLKLLDYRKSIISVVNEQQRDEFNKATVIVNRQLDTIQQGVGKFKHDYFSSSKSYEVLTYLSLLQNNIVSAANRVINYCNHNVVNNAFIIDDFYEALVGQNAKILKAGDQLEITAGIGAFSWRIHPQITINNKLITLDERGLANYKMKTSKKPGNYSLPVSVEFTDPDGKQQKRIIPVEYTLVEELKHN